MGRQEKRAQLMRMWAAKKAVHVLLGVIGVCIVTLEISRAALRMAVKWL